jgi:SsrA-binding protein
MGEKLICNNKKAFHNYFIEVKSLRMGKANLNDSFAQVRNGEAFLNNLHISPYDFGNRENHDPDRVRKLLLHKNEITKLHSKVREQGYSLVPLRLYFKDGLVKVEMGLAKGKRLYDKREDMKKEDQKREIAQVMKSRKRE